MKRLSLQWRITLMSVLLIGAACVAMKLLICFSGLHYMDSIGASIQGYTIGGEPAFFDPETAGLGQDVAIVVHGAQEDFCMSNWYSSIPVSLRVSVSICPLTVAVRERVSKVRPPQVSSTSCWVNCRNVRLRMRASSSARWKGFAR